MRTSWLACLAPPLLLVSACASSPPSRPSAPTAQGSADLRAAGYRVELEKGQLVYCRNEVQTGSVMLRKVCRNEDAARSQGLNSEQQQALRDRRTSAGF